MADNTKIEWAKHPVTGKGATWNVINGCTLVSEGCRHCYAARLAATRLKNDPSRQGLARINAAGEAKFTGEVRFNEKVLTDPLRWRTPRGIFVCAHGDLFHESVADAWIDRVFAVAALTPQHIYFVLTKRPERMLDYLTPPAREVGVHLASAPLLEEFGLCDIKNDALWTEEGLCNVAQWPWPLSNVWLGTSVEDQASADARIPHLLAAPAAKRFISAEPLLGPVDLRTIDVSADEEIAPLGWRWLDRLDEDETDDGPKLDWVIAGGESGPHARPMHPDWVRSLRDQCASARVPFFFKQWGALLNADQLYDRFVRLGAFISINGERWVPEARPLNYQDAQVVATTLGHRFEMHSDGSTYLRLGKDRAGHMLDGREHLEMPEVA